MILEVDLTALGIRSVRNTATRPPIKAQIWISVPPKEAPYAVGRLSAVNQQSALNLIGQMRYIAGLDGELALDRKSVV